MRLEITLKPQTSLDLPIHYNSHLRGLIYNHLEPSIAKNLHDHGYNIREKNYKLFTFSRLQGKSDTYYSKTQKQKRITFKDKLSITFSSIDAEDLAPSQETQKPQADALIGFAQTLLNTQEPIYLNKTPCEVDSVNIKKTPQVDTSKPITIKMLSPITIHNTYRYTDNTKSTHYYHPFDGLWQEKLFNNLLNKAEALGWPRNPEQLNNSHLTPTHLTKQHKTVMNDTGFWIEAWYGEYELQLPDNLFWLAYKAGLGARNSAGFGMFEVR